MAKDIPLHVVAVTAIIQKGDKYLLARRGYDDDQSPGEWSFPGGKVEHGVGDNRLEETLQKEVMEEVGVEIEGKVTLVCNDSFIRSSGDSVIMLTFLCYWKSGEAKPLEDQEEVAWMTMEEMLAMPDLPGYIRKRLEGLKKR